jgi:hypothetical protein
MVENPSRRPYIFMIRVTRQINCFIANAPGVILHPLPEVNYGLGVGISTIKKFTSGRGWGITPGALAIKQLICLVTLIINIYGLREGFSTIIKFTSVVGGV